MQTALQRPSHQQQHSPYFHFGLSAYQQPGPMTAIRPSRAGDSGARGFMAAEDSDNIDDILNSLWPTGSTPLAAPATESWSQYNNNSRLVSSLFVSPEPLLSGAMAMKQHEDVTANEGCFRYSRSRPPSQTVGSGQHTPPDNDAGIRVPFPMAMRPSQTQQPPPSVGSSYSLVAPSASPMVSTQPIPHGCSQKEDKVHAGCSVPNSNGLLMRSVSSSIQIGDPEWRVDSPQSVVHASQMHMHHPVYNAPGTLPSPVSPRMHVSGLAQPTSLGIGTGSSGGIRASRSASALGLLPHSARPAAPVLSPPRKLTPEERVARLHTVSGLAARAVARRCLSGQLPALDADAMLRRAGAAVGTMPSTAVANIQRKKLTFADVARGSNAPVYGNQQQYIHYAQH
ncbi:hypothetical protein IWW48_004815 [Coemansia sp. RSA 1200]|nr:hypothetical protein IWW48_004815 [Coemansia sp. RSA 1200]